MTPIQFIHILPRALWILAHSVPWWKCVAQWALMGLGVWLAKGEMREMRRIINEDFINSQRKEESLAHS